jgi:hypothetical protein
MRSFHRDLNKFNSLMILYCLTFQYLTLVGKLFSDNEAVSRKKEKLLMSLLSQKPKDIVGRTISLDFVTLCSVRSFVKFRFNMRAY